MFYISVNGYSYKEIKSAAEQVFLALMRGTTNAKIDNVTHTYFSIDKVDDMFVEIYLCDIDGFMISEDKFSMYLTDLTTDKMVAVMMSMMSDYHLWLYTDVLKHQPDSVMTIAEIGGQNDTSK